MTDRIAPKKSLGQNFLNDKNIIKKIVLALAIDENKDKKENVIEIGPGMGALTGEILLTKCTYSGIEIDSRAYDFLINKFPNTNFINQDFLKYNFDEPNHQSKERSIDDSIGDFKIIGNLPYYITSSIIFKVYQLKTKPTKCIFMVQKEVAERINGKVGTKDSGILSILTSFIGNSKKLFDVSPACFYPKPRVWSSIIEINFENKFNLEFAKFASLVKTAFNQRRKMLSNSLKSYGKLPQNFASKRPEQLTCEEFVELFNALNAQ